MRIAMLMSVFGEHAVGGAERCAQRIAGGLAARGHDIDLVALSAPRKDEPAGQTRPWSTGIRLTGVPLFQWYDPYRLSGQPIRPHGALAKLAWHGLDVYNPVMEQRLDEVWQRLKPDLVVTHTLQGFSVSAWRSIRRHGARVIHVLHDHSLMCPGTAMSRGTRMCESPCTSCAALGALRQHMANRGGQPDAVVAPSRDVLQRHLDHGWFGQVGLTSVIPNALPPDWPFADQPLSVGPGQPVRFAFVGRLDESKGVDLLLEAAVRLRGQAFELHVGGAAAPADFKRARDFVNQHGLESQVWLHGPVHTAGFLQDKHVLVAPSRARETFSMVTLEAAALGMPSIVSNRGALPERVQQGRCGWIFPAGKADELAGCMREAIDKPDLRRMKAQEALQLALRESVQDEAGAWERLCAQTLAAGGQSA